MKTENELDAYLAKMAKVIKENEDYAKTENEPKAIKAELPQGKPHQPEEHSS